MSMYLGDFLEDATVYIPFTTNASDGTRTDFSASLEEADIVVLKNGAAMTLDASTITISTSLGSRVGFHVVSINMANDADFTAGAEYAAVLYPSDETVDSKAPVGVLATWSCENRSLSPAQTAQVNAACDAAIETYGLDHLVAASVAGTDIADNSIIAQLVDNDMGAADWDNYSRQTESLKGIHNVAADTLQDTAELQTDWANGGRLDLILDIIAQDTTTDIPGLIAALNNLSSAQVTAAVPTATQNATAVWTVGNMATAAMKRIADFVLRRNTANAATSTETGLDTVSFRSPIGAIRKLTNKVDTTTNTNKLTVFEEDDATQAATQSLTTDAAAEPITGANTD